ncbi:MAG: aminotransferase class I/II-fold pyridoxal phosphate-dependent enzyme [Eubacterium sp.]|nr:aminotransferase class I/II-fold pyridoxal phosphate-dependent enzyme [Eubacterium sp.]
MSRFDTDRLHAGYNPADHNNAVAVPIYQTAAFEIGTVKRSDDMFSFDDFDPLYTRLSNPTSDVLNERLAKLHNATGAISLGSGMAAVTYSLLNVAETGGHIVAIPRLYGGSVDSFTQIFSKLNIEVSLVDDPDDISQFEREIKDNTKAIYIESITNPNATVLDIEEIAKVAHKNGIPLIVDNTLATPYLLNPFDYGADVVVYSATKALAGHGNVIAGAVVENGKFNWANGKFPQFTETPYFLQGQDGKPRSVLDIFGDAPFTGRINAIHLNYLGAVISPFDAFLVLTGIETLSERVAKQVKNAEAIVEFLEGREEVLWVKHPHAKANPYADLARKYLPKGAGGILSFGLKGSKEQREKFLESTEVFSFQANIGDAKSLIINPSNTTHIELNPQLQEKADILPETIRLSLGLEDIEDLIEDLERAFKKANI